MKMKKYHVLFSALIASLSLSTASFTSNTYSCSRILHTDTQGVFVGRNMDWFERMGSELVVFPRGVERSGMAKVNPLKWVSQYGSIVTTSYNSGSADGMNEKGLAIHGLWLNDTDYGQRNENIPGLSLMMAAYYYLDNFKTVNEAVRATESGDFQILPFYNPATGQWIKIHLAIEDATGDSAIIEYINGQPKIYHDKNYTTLTNSPTYDLQLENLKQYDGFGGDKPLPGTNSALDRFVRASYHNMHLPEFSSPREEVAGILSVLHNVSPPFSPFPLNTTKTHRTIWRSVADLTHHVYYFNSTHNMTIIYAQLDKFALQPGSPIMKLNLLKHPDLSGDVTDQFAAQK